VYENGMLVYPSTFTFNGYTTYPSAFMVIDPNGIYSNHYYAGSQRIVSRLGEENADIFNENAMKTSATDAEPGTEETAAFDDEELRERQIADLQLYLTGAGAGTATFDDYNPSTYEEEELVLQQEAAEEGEGEGTPSLQERAAAAIAPVYFYHLDHLGTSTFLTDLNGVAYQFFLNLPFGETMAEQNPNSYYKTPFLFTGKEKDDYTGLHYFGARYYDSRSSIWLSVDPLAESFPNWNPYNYTMQNPINLVDPTGLSPESSDPPGKGWNRFIGGLKLLGGTLEAIAGTAGGAATSWTGIGAVVGGAVAIHGTDVAGTGLKQLISGEEESTLTSQAIQSTGVSQQNADAIDSTISIVGTGGTSAMSTNGKLINGLAANRAAFSVAPKKFDYFFGRVVSGSKHNIDRSAQNLKDLTTLGIKTESQLIKIFNRAIKNGKVISTKTNEFGTTVTRSVNIGKKGSVDVGFYYEGGNMSATPAVSTIIPKIFK
ncbi:RHS repeat-associated core domain-containing protein, partial [Flavobacterium soli]|uniref:RHS repeat-associated core domain-containing protein n=1 Tax=Flavobacterium soli TaxID=344881 RepID=UPI0006881773